MPRRSLLATGHPLQFRRWRGRRDGDGLGEAGDGAFVTDEAVACDDDSEDQRVVVAVGGGGDDTQAVAAGFALHPELLAGAAPEGDEAGFQGFGAADGV